MNEQQKIEQARRVRDDKIIRLRRAGMTMEEIANTVGMTRQGVSAFLKRNGITMGGEKS